MSDHLQTIIASPWVLAIVFGVAGLDALVPFSPSETTLIAVGVGAATSGHPPLVLLIAAAAAGAYLGDRLSYLLGRRAARSVTPRLARSRRGHAAYEWARTLLDRRGGLLIVFARYLPGGRSATTLAAGLVGYPRARFHWYTLLAVTIWATSGGLLGYLGGLAFASRPLSGLLLAWATAALVALCAEAMRRIYGPRTQDGQPVGGTEPV